MSTSVRPELRARVIDILATTLDIEPDRIGEDFSPVQCEAWDSICHLTLILAIEDDFGITFEESQIWNLMSLAALEAAVSVRCTTPSA